MFAPRLALLALLHFYKSYRNLLKIHPWAMNKKLLKEGSGHIFKSCDISLKNTHTSYAVILALSVVILQCLIFHALAYVVTTNNSV